MEGVEVARRGAKQKQGCDPRSQELVSFLDDDPTTFITRGQDAQPARMPVCRFGKAPYHTDVTEDQVNRWDKGLIRWVSRLFERKANRV
jgi:hypothetical protein